MIYRAYFPEGILYRQDEGPKVLACRIEQAVKAAPPVMLPPRDAPYMLTSGTFGGKSHQYSMFVQIDGRGILAVTTIDLQRITREGHPSYLSDPDTESVKLLVLPDTRPFFMIALTGMNPGELQIVEMLYYYPRIPTVDPDFPFSLS